MSVSRWQTALQRLMGGADARGPYPGYNGPALEAQLDEFEAVAAAVAPPDEDALAGSPEPAALRRANEQRPPAEPGATRESAAVYGEYDMGDILTCSAEGITELVLDSIVDDARIRMALESTEIRVSVSSEGRESAELLAEGNRARLTGGSADRVEVPAGIAIMIDEAFGDVRVKGLSAPLRIGTIEGDLRLESTTATVEVERLHSDGLAEGVAALRIGTCAGDLRFSGGELEAQTVAGDLRVERATSVRGASAHGDVWIDRVEGVVEIGLVHGDARINDVGGPVSFGMISGDLRATAARGGLTAGQVHGDAQLEGPFASPAGYSVTSSGDVDVRLRAEDDARLSVRALGRIRSNLSLTPNADGTPSYTATLGEGKTLITIACNGDLRIDAAGRGEARRNWERRWGPGGDSFSDLSGLGDRIRKQVTESLAAAGINPETGEVNINFGPGRGRAGRGRGPETARPPSPPPPPPPPKPSTSSEQLTVLKMLEEGRITPEEADALLRALGA